MFALLIIGVVLIVIAGVTLWNRRSYSERLNLIRRAVPASAADVPNAYPGELVSISGAARNEQSLVSEQSGTPCIYYDFEVVRRYQRRRSILSVTGTGNRRRRSGSRRRRETVAENKQWVPFILQDQSGHVRVNPDGAWFEARKVMDRYEREQGNDLLGIPGLNVNLGLGRDRTLGYEIRENVIAADEPVYVVGAVNENGEITRSGNHGIIVSYRPESTLREEWGKQERRKLVGGLIAAGLGALSLFAAGVAFISSLF